MAQIWVHAEDGSPCYFGAFACSSIGCDDIVLADIPDYRLHQWATEDQLRDARKKVVA